MQKWPVKERITKVRKLIRGRKLDAIIVNDWVNLYYLLGILPIQSAERRLDVIMPLLIHAEDNFEPIFVPISNFLHAMQEEHEYIETIRPSGNGTGGMFPNVVDIISRIMAEWNVSLRTIGLESKYLPTFYADAIRRKIPQAKFENCSDIIESLRMIKSEEEKTYCMKACKIAEKVLETAEDFLKEGKTERDVSCEIKAKLIECGADDASFHPQVLSGRRGTLTNITSSDDKKIQRGEIILLDYGALYRGYRCDITRPFIIGKPTNEQKDAYKAIKYIEKETINSIHPRVKASEIHKVAVSTFSELGYPCTHNTGHGMGLQTWERPFISFDDQTILQPNMFIAIEQTIEKPLGYGIRFEDNIFVTENGYQNCIEFPMELVEI